MHAAAKETSLQRNRWTTIKFVCKVCGKTERSASLSSSTASSTAAPSVPKRKKIDKIMHHGTTQTTTESARWSNHVEYEFVDLMYDQVLKGNIYTTSFSPLVWSDIKSMLFERTGVRFEVKQLKGKHNRLKDVWKRYHDLMLLDTGIGWNHESNLPQAEPIIWEALSKSHAALVELRYKSFAHYQKLDVVFSGRAATGVNARASTQRPSTSRPLPTSDRDDDEIDLGSPRTANASGSNTRTTLSGGKRKVPESNVLERLVDTIDCANKAIADKSAQKENYAIEKVIDVLNTFDVLDPCEFNDAADYFHDEGHRRMFMYLSRQQQTNYLLQRFKKY